MVRAKFVVESVTRDLWFGQKRGDTASRYHETQTIKMKPVYSDDPESENRKFWDATPSGSLEFRVISKEAGDQFHLGQEFYLDFTPAGDPPTP